MMNDSIDKSISKGVEKGLETAVEGVAAFFRKICMPAAEEFGLLLRDRIAGWRLRNLYDIVRRTEAYIAEREYDISGSLHPRLLKEFVEEASWADDETVQRMWAGLMAGCASQSDRGDADLIYVNRLKDLSSYQARILNLVYGDPRICSVRRPLNVLDNEYDLDNELIFTVREFLDVLPRPLSDIVPIANVTDEEILNDPKNHGIAMGALEPQLLSLQNFGLIENWIYAPDREYDLLFEPNANGLDLYMRCTGYALYPLQAYILTRQHWCERKGIDPYTHEKRSLAQKKDA